jgi:hypothetical protein
MFLFRGTHLVSNSPFDRKLALLVARQVADYIRRYNNGVRVVLASCHYDVIAYLKPGE